MRVSLHNHTHFSDGAYSAEELIITAIQGSITHIGITDHYMSKNPESNSVFKYGIDGYIKELKLLQEKYSGSINVLVGLEIAFTLLQTDFSRFMLHIPNRNILNELDFVLFEYVQNRGFLGLDLAELIKIRPFLHMPVGLAHCDLSTHFEDIPPRKLIRLLSKNNIFVELSPNTRNSRAFDGRSESGDDFTSLLHIPAAEEVYKPYYRIENSYNRKFFSGCRKGGPLFSIGTDTHESREDVYKIQDAEDFLREKKLENSLICYHYWNNF